MMKQSKLFLLIALLLVAMVAFAACGEEGATNEGGTTGETGDKEVYTVKISHVVPETDVIHMSYLEAEEYLEASGRFDVTIYPNRQLSNSNAEDMEKVMANIVQVAAAPTSVLAGSCSVPEMQIFDYPFLFESTEELYYVMDNGLVDYLSEKVSAGSNMIVRSAVNGGWCPISDNIPYYTPEDMKGRLIRILNSDMYMKMLDSWGAVGSPIAWGETFTALQQGTVDGLLTSMPAWYSDRFAEVQDYINMINPVPIIHMTMVNGDFYNSLDDEAKQIFDEGMAIYDEAIRANRAQESADTIQMYKDGLVAGGVIEYTEEELQPFKDATQWMRDDYSFVGDECMELTLSLLEEYRSGQGAGEAADDAAGEEAAEEGAEEATQE